MDPETIVIVIAVLKELASGILGHIGAQAYESATQSNPVGSVEMTVFMKEILDGFSQVVKREIQANDLAECHADIDACNTEMHEYLNSRTDSLFRLQNVTIDCQKIISRLSQPDLSLPGLLGYITATSIRLVALQELAKTNPNELQNIKDEVNSSYNYVTATHKTAFHVFESRFGQKIDVYNEANSNLPFDPNDGTYVAFHLPLTFYSKGCFTIDGQPQGQMYESSLSTITGTSNFSQLLDQQRNEIAFKYQSEFDNKFNEMYKAFDPINEAQNAWKTYLAQN